MNDLLEKNIGEIVANDFRTAQVFSQLGIDFCCKGNRKLNTVCAEKKLDEQHLIDQLTAVQANRATEAADYSTWALDRLADYIVTKHHHYVEQQIPILKQYLAKLVKVHGQRHPELHEIKELFEASADELTLHMKKEELILFPFVKKLEAAQNTQAKLTAPHFGTVANPIAMMMQEHANEGERFEKIAAHSSNYTPPTDACNTYKVTFDLLHDFQDDLHTHIHLENNILFPRAAALEEKLLKLS